MYFIDISFLKSLNCIIKTIESYELEIQTLQKDLKELKTCLESKNVQLEKIEQENITLKNEIEELRNQNQSLVKENKDLECLFGYLQKQFKGLMRKMSNIDNLFIKQKSLIACVQEKHKEILTKMKRYELFTQNVEEFFIEKDKEIISYKEKLENRELEINNYKVEITTYKTKLEEELKRKEELKADLNQAKEDHQKGISELEKSLEIIKKQAVLLKSKDDRIQELEEIISNINNNNPQNDNMKDIDEESLKAIAIKEVLSAQIEESQKKYEKLLSDYESSKKSIDSLNKEISMLKMENHGKLEFLRNEIKELRSNRVELLNKIADLEVQLQQKRTAETNAHVTNNSQGFIDISDDIMDIDDNFLLNKKEENKTNHLKEENKFHTFQSKMNCCKEQPFGLIIKCDKCKGQFHASCIDYEQYGQRKAKYICNRCKVTPIKLERNTKKRKKTNILKIK